jgi:hypothetical protein
MLDGLQKVRCMVVHGATPHSPCGLPHGCHMRCIAHPPHSCQSSHHSMISPTIGGGAHTCMRGASPPAHLTPIPPSHIRGGLQGEWGGTSQKDLHISSLTYEKWKGPKTPTFTPRQRPKHATCIDHISIWDPHHLSRQVVDTQTLPSAFLDHNEVLGWIHLPILRPR